MKIEMFSFNRAALQNACSGLASVIELLFFHIGIGRGQYFQIYQAICLQGLLLLVLLVSSEICLPQSLAEHIANWTLVNQGASIICIRYISYISYIYHNKYHIFNVYKSAANVTSQTNMVTRPILHLYHFKVAELIQ